MPGLRFNFFPRFNLLVLHINKCLVLILFNGNIAVGSSMMQPMKSPAGIPGGAKLELDMSLRRFNVFGGGFCPKSSMRQVLKKTQQQLLSRPLFASFFRNHVNAPKNQTHTQYNKSYPIRQWQVFEEVTGKTDADNIFAKISDSFSGKLPRFFVEQMTHDKLLSLGAVGESSKGTATAVVTGINLLDNNAFGENALNDLIIASKCTLSNL